MVGSALKDYTTVAQAVHHMVQAFRIPHAQLFSGTEGGMTLSLAFDFVAYLHCTARKEEQACNECNACNKINKLIHPDVHYVFPIGPTQKIKNKEVKLPAFLPSWRSFIQGNPYGNLQDWSEFLGHQSRGMQIGKEQITSIRKVVCQESFESRYTTILVWLPEYLHPVAANTFLKMVEEPTPNTFFIFVSLASHRILPTLHSRMSPIYVPPLGNSSMYRLLKEIYPTCSKQELLKVVHVAQGNVRLAQQLLSERKENYFESFTKWLRYVYGKKFGKLVALAEVFHQYPTQIQKNWVKYALQCFRMVLRMPFDACEGAYLDDEEVVFFRKFSSVVPMEVTEGVIGSLDNLTRVLRRNANPKLAFMGASLGVAGLFAQE